jgi:tetratricopeptide (TPR) repeat protein
MSGKKSSGTEKKIPARIPKKYILVLGVVIVICIAIIAGLMIAKQGPWAGEAAYLPANQESDFMSAGALYCQSVDLANEGNYTGALADADTALAKNVSSLTPLIQANRAGILVALGRNNDAIAAADVAINAAGDINVTHAIAWYNKAHALQGLNRTAEAQAAFANASAFDPSYQSIPDHL